MKSINQIIAENICTLRKSRKMTQEQLAEMVNLSKNTIANIESRSIKQNNTINTIESIATALGVPAYQLLIDEDELDDFHSDKANAENITATYYPPVHYLYNISTLIEFLIYLPLIDHRNLYHNLISAVAGCVFDSELYISSKIDNLVRRIPDSPEKKFADFTFSKIRAIREGKSRDDVMEELFTEFPSFDSEYDAYLSIINNTQAKFDILNMFINKWNKLN